MEFDSSDLSGVIEDLDRLIESFQTKIGEVKVTYLESTPDQKTGSSRMADATGSHETIDGDDERLHRMVFGRFMSPETREEFYSVYHDIEAM